MLDNLPLLFQTIIIFNGRKLFLVFGIFSLFITMRMIGINSFWSFIMMFTSHFWNFFFLNGGTFSFGEDIISAVFFPGHSLSGVILIDDFEWLVDELNFIDKGNNHQYLVVKDEYVLVQWHLDQHELHFCWCLLELVQWHVDPLEI